MIGIWKLSITFFLYRASNPPELENQTPDSRAGRDFEAEFRWYL
jgi:hypothetical protein